MDVAVMEFVEAARLRGEGRLWIIFREILPNTLSPLLAEFGLRFAFAVLFLSTLSFLGLGIQPPEADWGGIVKDNKDGIIFGIPAALIPGAAIAALAISVNLVVDWLLNRTASLKGGRGRSEEHTSELQSLLRISYAVLCLQKKLQLIITT